jgi:hypothetical protein
VVGGDLNFTTSLREVWGFLPIKITREVTFYLFLEKIHLVDVEPIKLVPHGGIFSPMKRQWKKGWIGLWSPNGIGRLVWKSYGFLKVGSQIIGQCFSQCPLGRRRPLCRSNSTQFGWKRRIIMLW